jgi:tripartite-type tricarboxylate transporter receptor subunit TctC
VGRHDVRLPERHIKNRSGAFALRPQENKTREEMTTISGPMRVAASLALAITAFAALAPAAWAQDYPTRPVTLIVPWAAGGQTDITLRTLAEAASKHLGQPIVIENKAGGGGTVGGATMAATAKPDGYTIAQIPIGVFRLPIMQGATYDPLKDFTYIANIAGYVFATYCSAESKLKSWKDVVDYAKANPGKLTYASPGHGTSNNIGMELIAANLGVKFTEVPFKSTNEVNIAVAGNHTMCGVSGLDAKQLADAGKLTFVNVWSAERVQKVPDVPTLKELGVPFVFESPWGLAGPKGMDPKIVARLQDAFKKASEEPAVKEAFVKYEMVPNYMDAATYTKFVADYMVSERANLTKLGLAKKD